jgi:hypothetical protein
MKSGVVVGHDPLILIFKGEGSRMRKTTRVSLVATALALSLAGGGFAAALNPTPNRESKLLVGFETDIAVTSDPDGVGENRASINTDPAYVAEGSKSLKLELANVGAWHDPYFVIELPEPIDIQGHQVLSMDVYVPLESLDNGVPAGGWFQFSPRVTTTSPEGDALPGVSYYDNRDLAAGWNHLVWDLRNGTDTKVTRLAFAGNTNGDKPYSGPIYVDNVRAYKGAFHGIQPDEKLIFGFDSPSDSEFFIGPEGVAIEVNTDKQFVRSGNGSLKIDLTGQEGGWTSDVARASDWGTTVDVSNATALHLDLLVPEGHQPAGWRQLGFVVVGEGGEVWGAAIGFVPGQWNTLEIPLTSDQAQALTNVTGVFLIRNQDSSTPWNGPIYIDNLRAVVPVP